MQPILTYPPKNALLWQKKHTAGARPSSKTAGGTPSTSQATTSWTDNFTAADNTPRNLNIGILELHTSAVSSTTHQYRSL